MKDTPQYISDIQREIIHSKSDEDRSMMGAEMVDTVYEMIQSRIKEERPELTQSEVKAEIFLRYYRNEFTEQEKEKIISSIKGS